MQNNPKRREYEERVRLEAQKFLRTKKLKVGHLTLDELLEQAKQNGYTPPEYGKLLGKLYVYIFLSRAQLVAVALQNHIKNWRVSKVREPSDLASEPTSGKRRCHSYGSCSCIDFASSPPEQH
jgi:hypothetical protein